MSASEDMTTALKRIAEEAEKRTGKLDLSQLEISKLPAEIAGLKHLRRLDCSFTEISDLTPVTGLRDLQSLDCSLTKVSDPTPNPRPSR
jgi:internalin A